MFLLAVLFLPVASGCGSKGVSADSGGPLGVLVVDARDGKRQSIDQGGGLFRSWGARGGGQDQETEHNCDECKGVETGFHYWLASTIAPIKPASSPKAAGTTRRFST